MKLPLAAPSDSTMRLAFAVALVALVVAGVVSYHGMGLAGQSLDRQTVRDAASAVLRGERAAAADAAARAPESPRLVAAPSDLLAGLRQERLLDQANTARRLARARLITIAAIAVAVAFLGGGGWRWRRASARREQVFQNALEIHRLVIDGVQEHAIFTLDTRGYVNSWNAGAQRIKGYTAAEIIGRHFSCFFLPADIERGKPETVLRLAAAAANGYEEDGIRVRKDGSHFLSHVTFSALRDSAGRLRGFSEFSHDISQRQASEARYRGLLEAAPDAMVVVDARGYIVLLNVRAEQQFGYRRDELIGQMVTSIIPEGFAERVIADALRSVEDAGAQQIGTGIELAGLRKDGSGFPLEIMLSPLDGPHGIVITAAIRDITARKSAEALLLHKVDELHRSNEELGQFAYIASHDLQEPLRMVASYTQLLSKRYKGRLDADADDFIGFAVDGATRMQQLIQDLLAYSRVGSTTALLVSTSSAEALDRALVNLHGAIEECGASVTHDVLPAVLADQTQLVQLFQNLVGNAIKYHGVDVPEVHISAVTSGHGRWEFAVRDNGLGIERQYFERIFGMFQRLHKREDFDGTGIGLAIAKKIVERHGGIIAVESAPGMGSTFRFSLAGTADQREPVPVEPAMTGQPEVSS